MLCVDVVFFDIEVLMDENLMFVKCFGYMCFLFCECEFDLVLGFVYIKDFFCVDEMFELFDEVCCEVFFVFEM